MEHPNKPVQPGTVRIYFYTRILIRPSQTEFGVFDYEKLLLFNLGGYVPSRLYKIIMNENIRDYEKTVKLC